MTEFGLILTAIGLGMILIRIGYEAGFRRGYDKCDSDTRNVAYRMRSAEIIPFSEAQARRIQR